MRKRALLLGAVLSLLAMAGTAGAQTATGQITSRVYESKTNCESLLLVTDKALGKLL